MKTQGFYIGDAILKSVDSSHVSHDHNKTHFITSNLNVIIRVSSTEHKNAIISLDRKEAKKLVIAITKQLVIKRRKISKQVFKNWTKNMPKFKGGKNYESKRLDCNG